MNVNEVSHDGSGLPWHELPVRASKVPASEARESKSIYFRWKRNSVSRQFVTNLTVFSDPLANLQIPHTVQSATLENSNSTMNCQTDTDWAAQDRKDYTDQFIGLSIVAWITKKIWQILPTSG